MMRGATPGELDGTNRGDLSIGKVRILRFQSDDQLTHGNRKGAVMILSLLFGGPEEANNAVSIEGISSSTQAPFRQTRFLCPFCWWNTKKGDGANPFIQALFWCSTPLLDEMVVVCSLPMLSLGLWHTYNSRDRGKGDEAGRILYQLDDFADMLREKLDHDNDLLRT
jgi:hypothetical protein